MSERDTAYDKIDRYLRNNLDDADYADYSAALDLVYGDASAQPAPGQAPIAHLRAMSSTEQWSSWEVCPPDDGNAVPVFAASPAPQEVVTDTQRREELDELLAAVPLPPNAITYEKGWWLIDRLQLLATKYAAIRSLEGKKNG